MVRERQSYRGEGERINQIAVCARLINQTVAERRGMLYGLRK
jgi:hypothetical protein